MHSAESKVDQARAKFQTAQKARKKLLDQWSSCLEQSIARWRSLAEDFSSKDRDLEEKVNQAGEKLQEACTYLDKAKELHSKQDEAVLEGAAEVISDAEDEGMKIETAEVIRQGIDSVVTNLENIQVRPGELSEEEAASTKKARLGESGGCYAAFLQAGPVDLKETGPRPLHQLCFRDHCDFIRNHSILEEPYFVSPWQASIDALGLSYEVGTGAQISKLDVRSGVKKRHSHRVAFASSVELLVGSDLDWSLVLWPNRSEVPHTAAHVLCSLPGQSNKVGLSGRVPVGDDNESDMGSFMAVHAAHITDHGSVAVMNNPGITIDADQEQEVDVQIEVEASSESSWSSMQDVYRDSAWHTTLIFSMDKDTISRIPDWNDY